jgi:Spy/CpxP family protein refolding chaperone
MKSSQIRLLVVALALTLTAAVAVSQTVKPVQMHGDEMFGGHMLNFFADYLNLTDAQQAQMKDILAKEKPTIQPLVRQVAQSHRQLRQLEMSGSFDEAKARALVAQQSANLTELIVQKARIESELFQVLTPEQKTTITQFMQRHEQRLAQHMQEQTQSQ